MFYCFCKKYSNNTYFTVIQANNKTELLLKILDLDEDYFILFSLYFNNVFFIKSNSDNVIHFWFRYNSENYIYNSPTENKKININDNKIFLKYLEENLRIKSEYFSKIELLKDINLLKKVFIEKEDIIFIYKEIFNPFNPFIHFLQYSNDKEKNPVIYNFIKSNIFDRNLLKIIKMF
jgi:hypothetical protein